MCWYRRFHPYRDSIGWAEGNMLNNISIWASEKPQGQYLHTWLVKNNTLSTKTHTSLSRPRWLRLLFGNRVCCRCCPLDYYIPRSSARCLLNHVTNNSRLLFVRLTMCCFLFHWTNSWFQWPIVRGGLAWLKNLHLHYRLGRFESY